MDRPDEGQAGGRKLLLVFTNSYDLSTNRIIERIGTERVFRFNFDLWPDYDIRIWPTGFRIVNPTGFAVTRSEVAKAYWRKPISRFHLQGHRERRSKSRVGRAVERLRGGEAYPPRMTAQERYLEAEMDYAVSEIRNLLWRDRKLVLVEPASHGRLGKLVQLDVAARYFKIPPYEFFSRPGAGEGKRGRCVVKSLSGERLGANSFLWTRAVDRAELSGAVPWFVQDIVEAERDLTVVHIRGRNFAFDLERSTFIDKSVDWREFGDLTTPLWRPCAIPDDLRQRIDGYMAEIGLDFGRLDFLQEGEASWFLEVNSNGEWGWLDFDGTRGVLNALVDELHPDFPVRPIPLDPFSFPDRMKVPDHLL